MDWEFRVVHEFEDDEWTMFYLAKTTLDAGVKQGIARWMGMCGEGVMLSA